MAIADAYKRDPIAYWAVSGLPALARSADIRERDGVANPNGAFDLVMKSFNAEKFLAACEREEVHPLICEYSYSSKGPGTALPAALRVWVARGDAERFSAQGPGPISEQTTRGLREVLTTSFDAGGLIELAPAGAKTADELPDVTNVVCTPPADSASDAGASLTWEKVADSAPLAGGKPDGMCVTKAVGICTQRLGMHGPTVTPEAWQELSAEVGSTGRGASIDGMKSYFEGKGYGFSEAWDGPLESATTEAFLALARGCDVFLWYNSGEKESHIEVVEDVDIANRPSGEAVITTNSWGQRATAKVNKGTYSDKSDVDRYGADFRRSDKATLYYACPSK